jgi:hypothetical protein
MGTNVVRKFKCAVSDDWVLGHTEHHRHDGSNGDQFSPGYIQWVEAGGVPDPYVPPEPVPPQPTTEQTLLFEHENRILALEGQPPITVGDFLQKVTAPPT